ncbi:MAG: carboxylating nicotinate-nucleotide diphosphorylase [Gemmatimonadetes bacterium]|nr:carboxylating nicotinate-nucleotide diphosphorylase [Gemmatimonadota bacterium]NNK47278.1 carboxylating nicotinate-nucleotide diphosphorylase [Gemmatimonadota bacterium]
MSEEIVRVADPLIRRELEEDIGDGDRTSEWTIPAALVGEARILAKEHGVVCGAGVAARAFTIADENLEVAVQASDGTRVGPGETLVWVSGSLRSILAAERTALNFLARLSGVATLTARYVEAVAGTGCRVADTRKTTPGWRTLEKYAVAAGGGMNHRRGLYDMVLIKENHIRAAGGVAAAIEAAQPNARREGLEVEVEVTNEAELEEAVRCAPDRVMLDNMSVAELRAAVAMIRNAPAPRPRIEASGGVTLDSVRDIARTGVDYISVGALTHSAPALDLSLLVTDR